MNSRDLALAAHAYARDLRDGMVRQIDSKGIKVVAVGAAVALVLGLGAGFIGRRPIDRALRPQPMRPVAGTSQIATATPPLTAPPSPSAPTPTVVAERDDTPTVATGDDPPDDAQVAQTDETAVDAAATDSASTDAPPQAMRSPRFRFARQHFHSFRQVLPDFPSPWAYQGPSRWASPPPPPDYDPY